jgi:hypothetical protein
MGEILANLVALLLTWKKASDYRTSLEGKESV